MEKMDKMGKKMEKCKAPGCSKWVLGENDSGFCSEHQYRIDPISALYVDKTPEQVADDDRAVEFFAWLLQHRNVEELFN
ncbi:MAG: hypothetical protein M1455_05325 [Actinobacteria bacterium]|nr:hypothetical protein [Actinomycetota bacterium]